MIDKIKEEQKDPFKTEFTDDRLTDAAGLVAPENLETLKEKLESYNRRLSEKGISESDRQDIKKRKKEVKRKIKVFEEKVDYVMKRIKVY